MLKTQRMVKKAGLILLMVALLLSFAACSNPFAKSPSFLKGKDQPVTEEEAAVIQETQATAEKEAGGEKLVNGMRPSFKEAMDSYESFIDEYCKIMADDNVSLTETARYMAEYYEFLEKLEQWDEEDMNDTELKYYTKVTLRCSEKMIDSL